MRQNRTDTEYDPVKILAERKRALSTLAHQRVSLDYINGRPASAQSRSSGPCPGCRNAPGCATRLTACAQFAQFVVDPDNQRGWEAQSRIPTRDIYLDIFPGCRKPATEFYRRDFGDHPAETRAAQRLRAENMRRHRKVYPVSL
jgi:hypothetical protein